MTDAYYWIYLNSGVSLEMTGSLGFDTYEKSYDASYNGQCFKTGGPIKISNLISTPYGDCDSMR